MGDWADVLKALCCLPFVVAIYACAEVVDRINDIGV